MPVLTALLGQTAPPNPVFPPNNLSDSKGMHVGEGDFVGARWRQGWVSSLSPQLPPPRPGRCAPPSCLVHCPSCCLRKTRLPAELPTSEAAADHIKKTSLPPRKDSFHQENHMGSQDLTNQWSFSLHAPSGGGEKGRQVHYGGRNLDIRCTCACNVL